MIINIIKSADKQRHEAQQLINDLIAIQSTSTNPQAELAIKLNDNCGRHLAQFITDDPAMLDMKDEVRLLARTNDPVLITGPSGTGKELIARALHGYKHITSFHPINCAGMPEQLIESELFGHTAGAFTGARGDYLGILRAANDGTVFLDEIGEAPMHLQAKLLRALQPGHNGNYYIRPVGSTKHEPINCRIIAATKKDLYKEVQEGKFREDLYGRLMTFELAITPLSSRPGDKLLILKSLGCNITEDIESEYWRTRIDMFNVRALQAYARRQQLFDTP